jgi:hypothetical protein
MSEQASLAARLYAVSEAERSLEAACAHLDEARWVMEQDEVGGQPALATLVNEAAHAAGRALEEARAVHGQERDAAAE